jgi:D-xylose 1-dehydrogenase (NADP+, D-xylono-1,5-lactone-forming)
VDPIKKENFYDPNLRWGLLSTARINTKLIPAIQLSDRSQLAAVASRDLERARRYAAERDIPHAFGSYDEMLASDKIDAVYISLPNDQHATWTIRALQAGKHVLCEKPFALTVSEVEQMIAAARSSGRVLAEAFMYLHHPQTRIILDAIQAGKIGTVRALQGCFHFSLKSLQDPRAIPAQGGGSIWDIGVYPISFIQRVLGVAPSEVTGWQHTGSTGVDMTFAGQMRFSTGVLAQFTSSFESPFHVNMDIYGSEGKIEVTRPFSDVDNGIVRITDSSGIVEELAIPRKHLYLGEIEDMERVVFDGQPQLVPLAQTASHVRTVLALLRSARENRPVTCDWSLV